ncbi:hypothetical protein MPER_10664, partial [Moniliophthora perniciosa FA553]
QLLDEGMSEKEKQELEDAEAICRRFLAWNIQGDDGEDVKRKLVVVYDKLYSLWISKPGGAPNADMTA